jgi:UDP-glucose 4-epimerase
MRVVIVGATGNVGTSVVESLAADSGVDSVLGLARRVPDWQVERTDWAAVDVTTDDLVPLFRGADAVIHLAWLFQPTRDPIATWRVNVLGTVRVLDAVAAAGVPVVVCASSVGAYSPGPKETMVDESWPTHGWPTASYTREKAYVERLLDGFEAEHPAIRVVRLRPGFIFKRTAAAEQRRLFAGPFLPHRLIRPGLLRVVPRVPGLRFQALHTADVADAYRLAVTRPVRGPFNLAAEPVVDADVLAGLFGATAVSMPRWPLRSALAAAWHLRVVPASPQLFDAVVRLPLMDVARARTELDWHPRHTSVDALREFLAGLTEGAGMEEAPPLHPKAGGRAREREMATGVGTRDGAPAHGRPPHG